MVERDPTHGIELKETHTQRVPQQRRRIHLGESELWEINLCVSIVVCLTTLCSNNLFYNSASIYFGVLFLCVQGLAIHFYSPTETLHQVVLELELEEERNSDICAGSACDRSDRSLQPV